MPQSPTWKKFLQTHAPNQTPTQVAQRTGINQSTIWKWMHEGTKRAPGVDAVLRFAEVYQVPPTEALVAAGILTPEQAEHRPLSSYPTQLLLAELTRRAPAC